MAIVGSRGQPEAPSGNENMIVVVEIVGGPPSARQVIKRV